MLDCSVMERLSVRGRGIAGMKAPWCGLLKALAVHVHVYCDPVWYTENDARVLEELAREVRERVEWQKEEVERRGLEAREVAGL